MAYNNNREFSVNEEQIAAFLKDAVSRVENASEADVKVLNQIKKLFKKNVPFSRRSYVAAYLIKNANLGFRSNRFNNRNDRFNRNERSDRNERFNNNSSREDKHASSEEKAPRVTIDASVAGTIFISVGRSRGVFPRDLVGLLVSVAGFDRSRIGEIRVLSNYSFVQLFAEDCEKAIKALDGYEYRGRKLSVSFSKKKEDAENVAASVVESDDTIPANVSNEGHADNYSNSEESKLAAEQRDFAASMSSSVASDEKPYSQTSDDGQVRSHFGDGAAY